MEETFKLIVTGGAGVVALCFVFWMLFKELPEQRKSREALSDKHRIQIEAMVTKHQEHVENLMKDFRAELSTERASCREERTLDREARHAVANALNANNLVISEIAEHIPDLKAARRKA